MVVDKNEEAREEERDNTMTAGRTRYLEKTTDGRRSCNEGQL